jgi:hypothetical protein
VCIVLLLVSRALQRRPNVAAYATALVAAFVLYCAMLTWQPWGSRLQLPLFVLWAPIIGLVLSIISPRRLTGALMVVLLLCALPYALTNSQRPLMGSRTIFTRPRSVQYFSENEPAGSLYLEASRFLLARNCVDIGLLLGWNSYEYPLWVLIQQRRPEVRFEHVDVRNVSAALSLRARYEHFNPCAVFVTADSVQSDEKVIQVNGAQYLRKWERGSVGVFLPR